MAEPYVRDVEQAVERYGALGWPKPRALVVSGSGLAVDLGGEKLGETGLQDLLPFPVHSVIGHPHAVELIQPAGREPILYQRGRLHSYQGYDAHQTVLVVRMAARLGAKTLVMTNAAGGLRKGQHPGDLLLIRDHLNLSGLNPLRGEPPTEWGPRFPDLTAAYDPDLRHLASTAAAGLGIELGEGIYAGLSGPSYETPAEVRMLQAMGADLAGMSTVLEVIAARHMGVRCLCFSLVSNPAAGVAEGPVHHEEVLEAGRAAAGKVKRLLDALLSDPTLTSGA